MTHRDSSSMYVADSGHLFVRKSDGFVMGDGIDLGIDDTIDNYEERAFSAEEIASFDESIGFPGIQDHAVWNERVDEV